MGSSPRLFDKDNDDDEDEDDDDLFQELRDVAFKFSSAMTGVTESPARFFIIFILFMVKLFFFLMILIMIFVNFFMIMIMMLAFRWMTCTAKAVNAFGFAAAHEYIKVQRKDYHDNGDDSQDDNAAAHEYIKVR